MSEPIWVAPRRLTRGDDVRDTCPEWWWRRIGRWLHQCWAQLKRLLDVVITYMTI